jgi:hypothetical protein
MKTLRNRTHRFLVLALPALTLSLPPSIHAAAASSRAPAHVVTPGELDRVIEGELERADADRQAIRQLLANRHVQEVAQRAGLDVSVAARGVDQLAGQELEDLAARARLVNADILGGDTIVISATTIIIVLLIIVVLILIVD